MATIAEILRMSVEQRKTAYSATGIDKVIIDGNEFTDYKAFSFIWEKSYVKSPERSGDGSITNLNSYATFTTPHLKIDFSLMSIDSYRRLMELIYSRNEFLVTCYDIVGNRTTTNKMYFATEEMPKLWTIARALNGEEWVELLGVQEYVVEMIGTNADVELVSILYYDNEGNLLHSQEAENGTEAIIDFSFAPSAGKFDGLWLSANGTKYYNGSVMRINVDDSVRTIALTADVKDENQYTLSFDYGIGVEPVKSVNAQPILNIPILKGQTISSAINSANIQTTNGIFAFPENGTGLKEVEYEFDGKKEKVSGNQVYSFSGWFWTSVENAETKLTGATAYNYNVNRTIHQIYKAIPHTLTYDTGTTEIYLGSQSLGYGESVSLPTLARNGYAFKGWVLESGNKAPTIMPPHPMKVVAVWEKL